MVQFVARLLVIAKSWVRITAWTPAIVTGGFVCALTSSRYAAIVHQITTLPTDFHMLSVVFIHRHSNGFYIIEAIYSVRYVLTTA